MNAPATTRQSALTPGRITFAGVISSEWIKLRSLRSTGFSLLAMVVIIVGLGTLFSALRAHRFQEAIGPDGHIFKIDATQISLRGVFLAQLAVGVLGVLVITGEYSTGMIRSSIAAVPHRQPVLIAKAAVFAIVVFLISIVSTFAAFVLGQRALASTHEQATLNTPDAVRAIVGGAVYLTLIGLLAVGLGFLIRNTAGAIATLFGIVLVAPLLVNALPNPYSGDIAKYLPLYAGTQIMTTVNRDPSMLGPWAGLGVVALYAIAALIGGAIVLNRLDA